MVVSYSGLPDEASKNMVSTTKSRFLDRAKSTMQQQRAARIKQPAASSSATQQPTTPTHNLSFLYCALRSRLHQLHSSLSNYFLHPHSQQ